jgi:hypothetical protein
MLPATDARFTHSGVDVVETLKCICKGTEEAIAGSGMGQKFPNLI